MHIRKSRFYRGPGSAQEGKTTIHPVITRVGGTGNTAIRSHRNGCVVINELDIDRGKSELLRIAEPPVGRVIGALGCCQQG